MGGGATVEWRQRIPLAECSSECGSLSPELWGRGWPRLQLRRRQPGAYLHRIEMLDDLLKEELHLVVLDIWYRQRREIWREGRGRRRKARWRRGMRRAWSGWRRRVQHDLRRP